MFFQGAMRLPKSSDVLETLMWDLPIPGSRWRGFRRRRPGIEAFASLAAFEEAALNELDFGLADHELATLGRLLKRGVKIELEVFIRSHGPNPIFDPQTEIDAPVEVAK